MNTVMHQPATVLNSDVLLERPAFYRNGLVATVTCDYGREVQIHREGACWMQQDGAGWGTRLQTADDYRDAWGMSGQIPRGDDGWSGSGDANFALFSQSGQHLGHRYTLSEAIAQAQESLITSGRKMLATAVAAAA